MSDEKIKLLSDKQREKNSPSIKDAIRRAKQHIRNLGADTGKGLSLRGRYSADKVWLAGRVQFTCEINKYSRSKCRVCPTGGFGVVPQNPE